MDNNAKAAQMAPNTAKGHSPVKLARTGSKSSPTAMRRR
jgi:hypothetical protein